MLILYTGRLKHIVNSFVVYGIFQLIYFVELSANNLMVLPKGITADIFEVDSGGNRIVLRGVQACTPLESVKVMGTKCCIPCNLKKKFSYKKFLKTKIATYRFFLTYPQQQPCHAQYPLERIPFG